MSEGFCSLTGARTFLDSNLVHLDVIDAGNIARNLMGQAAVGVSPALLSDVLHEAVHHWCLNSRVGLALTLARVELTEALLLDRSGERGGRCYIRYLTAVGALRPVIEGLACFAEFDAAPGSGNLRVPPLAWLARIACPEAFLGPGGPAQSEGLDETILRALRLMRSLESTAARKDHLLVQPLDPLSRGGYLTGYLLVKGLQARVREVTDLADDTELWLAFLFAYIFADAALAYEILRPPDPDTEPTSTQGFADRLLARLLKLSDPEVAGGMLTAYNDAFGSADPDTDAPLGNTPSAVAAWASLQSLHIERLTEVSDRPVNKAELAVNLNRRWAGMLLENREWICVASAPGSLDVLDSGRVVFHDEAGTPRFAAPADRPPGGSKGAARQLPAALEFWVGPPAQGAVYALASEQGFHAHVALWGGDISLLQEFLATARSNAVLIARSNHMHQIVDDLIAQQSWADGARELVQGRLKELLCVQSRLAVALYGGGADAVAAMWRDGFFDIFQSKTLLRAVSACGLLASTGWDDPDDSRFSIITRAELAAARTGMSLASEHFGHLLI